MRLSTKLFLLIAIFLIALTIGCSDETLLPPGEVPEGTRILVANSLGETLSQYIYKDGAYIVQNDIVSTGQAPSQIRVRDNKVYVVNSLSNSILVLDLMTMNVILEASVGTGKSPFNMDFINDNEILVTNFMADDCVRLNINPDFQGNRVVSEISLPVGLPKDFGVASTNARPQAVFVAGNRAYVTMANLNTATWETGGPGMIAIIDLLTNQVTSAIQTTGRNTVGLCHDPYNPTNLYVISAGDNSFNPTTYEIEWSMNGRIDRFDLTGQGITNSKDINGAPFEMVIGTNRVGYISDGSHGRIHMYDMFLDRISSDTIELAPSGEMSYVSGLAWGPNNILYALQFNKDEIAVIDTMSGNQILERFNTGHGPDAITVLF